jgi:glycosyltransferase involved in cell wall biosynthesis
VAVQVGVDARFAAARYDGVGRYTVALLEGLLRLPAGPAVLALWPQVEEVRHALAPDDERRLRRLPVHAAPETARGQWELLRGLRGERLDVWHQPFPAGPLPPRVPRVVTVHDCIPERGHWPGNPRRLYLYRAAVWSAVRGAAAVVVPSESTAADVARIYGVPHRRIEVIPMGQAERERPDDQAVAAELAALAVEPGGYLLTVGRPRPHKGYALLARALGALPGERRPLWVHVGRPDPRLPDGHEEVAHALGVPLRSLRDITDATLAALYRGARLVALPSRLEGFGLPLLEAMAAGAPVLAADIQPFRATGGEVARLVPAGDERTWAAALCEALGDTAWQVRARQDGPAQAARFPWSETARRTAELYARVA